jgi:hypothetical protein
LPSFQQHNEDIWPFSGFQVQYLPTHALLLVAVSAQKQGVLVVGGNI